MMPARPWPCTTSSVTVALLNRNSFDEGPIFLQILPIVNRSLAGCRSPSARQSEPVRNRRPLSRDAKSSAGDDSRPEPAAAAGVSQPMIDDAFYRLSASFASSWARMLFPPSAVTRLRTFILKYLNPRLRVSIQDLVPAQNSSASRMASGQKTSASPVVRRTICAKILSLNSDSLLAALARWSCRTLYHAGEENL